MVRRYYAKKKKYSREDLLAAIEDVRASTRNAYRASLFYKVPRTTILNHIKGKCESFKVGRKTALTETAERVLVRMLLYMSDMALGLDRDNIRLVVANFVKEKNLPTPFKNGIPGKDWLQS
jgi:hypothetical protein